MHRDTDVAGSFERKADHTPTAGAVVTQTSVNEWEVQLYDENGEKSGESLTVYGNENAALSMARSLAPDARIERMDA